MATKDSYEYKLRTTPSHKLSSQERKDLQKILKADIANEVKQRLQRKDKATARTVTTKQAAKTADEARKAAQTKAMIAGSKPPALKKPATKPSTSTGKRFRGRGGAGLGGMFGTKNR